MTTSPSQTLRDMNVYPSALGSAPAHGSSSNKTEHAAADQAMAPHQVRRSATLEVTVQPATTARGRERRVDGRDEASNQGSYERFAFS